MKSIMESHNDGEVWGLAEGPMGNIVSTGDDNKAMIWDPKERKCVKKMMITSDERKVKGASSQSTKPSSQQARAVAFFNNCCVVACNDGCVRIKGMDGSDQKVITDSK
jgi:WD40 repeat protein